MTKTKLITLWDELNDFVVPVAILAAFTAGLIIGGKIMERHYKNYDENMQIYSRTCLPDRQVSEGGVK